MNLQNLIDYCREMGEPDILSGVLLPGPLDNEKCKSAIVMRCGMLTPVYGEPAVLRDMIKNWFSARQWNFEHLIKVIQAEYSPIENTDKYSEHSIKRDGSNTVSTSGSDTTRLSGSDRTASSGTDTRTRTPNLTNTITNEISAENASTYQPDNKTTATDTGTETDALQHGKTDTITYGKTDTTTYGKSETAKNDGTEQYIEHTHGNIGVTTNTTLINEELSLLRRFNAYDWIAERIEEQFFIMLY